MACGCPARPRFSPLLVGSVVATYELLYILSRVKEFQSPIGRVSGCNLRTALHSEPCEGVSVPYWSGQWLQLTPKIKYDPKTKFQSPIGRVSGCNKRKGGEINASEVSVPYWSGQWLQPPTPTAGCSAPCCFSPLLVGSVVATPPPRRMRSAWRPFQSPIGRVSGCNRPAGADVGQLGEVSVPYWSGQWLQLSP